MVDNNVCNNACVTKKLVGIKNTSDLNYQCKWHKQTQLFNEINTFCPSNFDLCFSRAFKK